MPLSVFAKPCVKEDIDSVVVSAEMPVLFDELQKIPLLFPADSFSRHGVIDDHRCQLKTEWVLADQVIIHCHLECRPQNASNRMNRAIPSAVHLLKLDEPCFGIRQAHLVNAQPAERLFFQDVNHRLVGCDRIMTDANFQRHILFHQFQNRELSAVGYDVIEQVGNLSFILQKFSHSSCLIQITLKFFPLD